MNKKLIVILISITIIFNIFTIIGSCKSKIKKDDDLPSSFSWCNIDGVNYVTSVKNQYPTPSCEAYALCAALETLVQYKLGYTFECDLSEAHLFFYPNGTCNWGVDVSNTTRYLVQNGVPDEGCFPDPHWTEDHPFESLKGWENRTVKIKEWGWVENDVETMKRALIEHSPLVVRLLVRPELRYFKGDGVYRPETKRVLGGHLVTIVGYDDSEQCWIIKNSWGERWGDNGYFKLAYDAHNSPYPIWCPLFAGTGILYVDGVYGEYFNNFRNEIPKVIMETPKLHYNYIFGKEIPQLNRKVPCYPIIIGKRNKVIVSTSNVDKVEFYLDEKLKYTDNEEPFEWIIRSFIGKHTIEVFGYNDKYISKDIVDVHTFFSFGVNKNHD